MSRTLVQRANLTMFTVLVGVLLLMSGLTWVQVNAARSARLWSQHTDNVISMVKDFNLAIRNAETGQRGYLLTGRDDYLAPYQVAIGRVLFLQGELQRLTVDNPGEQARLQALSPVLQHKLDELAQTIELRRTAGLDAAMRIVRTDAGRNDMKQLEVDLTSMTAAEETLLAQRLAVADRRGVRARMLLLGGVATALLALLWAARMLHRAWLDIYRAEAEQRTAVLQLRASLDSLSQGVAVFDAVGTLANWNECFQVLLALPKAMVRIGTPYAAFEEQTIGEDGTAMLESEAQIRHATLRPGEPVVYERIRPGGEQLELRRSPMPDGGFVLTVTNMTKRAQAEAVLREAQKMQAIGQLTGGIAHDFNNLLTVILGNLEMTHVRLASDPVLQARIERATWAAQRGAVLTAQLLAFARKQPLAPAAIDLTASLPELVPLMRRTLGAQIEIRYVDAGRLWPAMADPAQLESAVLNLALNARDAMPGGGRLTIELSNQVLDADYARAHHEVAAGDYVMLAVSDTGHGMTPELLTRVFEPFFTTKPNGKGTGLGLAMVFGFVKQSGGHVKIYSEPGEGTTVRLYLPRALTAAAAAPARSDAPLDLPRGEATVLVVEDEPGVREIAVAILEDLGYRVLDAADGEHALRIFGAHAAAIDLLLTDVVLPGTLRGREIAERITAMRPEVKVIYMSGYTENSIVHHGRLDDGVQLITKPFKREELARKVADVLGRGTTARNTVVDLRPRRAD